MRKIHVFCLLTCVFIASSCGVIQNPFDNQVSSRNACGTNFKTRVELVRVSFLPSSVFSEFKLCDRVAIQRDLGDDSWGLRAALLYQEGSVLVDDTAANFGVGGNLHRIGSPVETPEAWKIRKDKTWQKLITTDSRRAEDVRKVKRVRRDELDCWRIEMASYHKGVQNHAGLGYTCWDPKKPDYPMIDMGGGITYWQGKPLYDWDLDKDLFDPVFASLKLKDIPKEVYEERMQAHKEKVEEECERRIDDIRDNRLRPLNAHEIERLEFCGYDTSKLIRKKVPRPLSIYSSAGRFQAKLSRQSVKFSSALLKSNELFIKTVSG